MILRSTFATAALASVLIFAPGFASSSEPDGRTMSASAPSLRGQFTQPFGTTVLYDQSGAETTNLIAQYFTDFPTFRSQIADDFVVTGASNWTILSVVVGENTATATNLPGTTFNVAIYPDAAGAPSAEAVCDYSALAATFDATRTIATIPLLPVSESCVLVPGTYWVSATPVIDFASGGYYYASLRDTGIGIGATPVWRNPGGAYGGNCPNWTPINACSDLGSGFPASAGTVFQLLGHVGGQPGRIDLTVTMAKDNGTLSQCGTATTLQATVGDRINFCYTVVNRSPLTLNYQSLSDSVVGNILNYSPRVIAPGATYQFNRLVVAVESETPVSTWRGSVTLPGYSFSAGTYDFVDITATGTALNLTDDAGTSVTTPFPITLGETTSSTLCIENNGIIFLGLSGGCSSHWNNTLPPAASLPAPALMPFWDDLYDPGNVYYQTVGVAPNRKFIVEYYNKTGAGVALVPGYTFEVVFNESDGTFDFNYQNVTVAEPGHTNGLSASVALQVNAGLANVYSHNTASLSNGQNIHWQLAMAPIAFSNSATVFLDVGAPRIFAIPGPVDATAPVASTVVTPLFLLNSGNRDLLWTVQEAPEGNALEPVPLYRRPLTSEGKTHIDLPDVSERAVAAAPASAPVVPSGSETVPAYGMAYYAGGNQYVRLDAEVPGTLTTIAAINDTFYAGTFANFDFSTQYIVSSTTGGLYSISTTTGVMQLIGSTGLPAGEIATSIRWDASTGNTYLMSANCTGSPVFSNLYKINLATAGLTVVANDVGFRVCNVAMAINPSNGQLYALDAASNIIRRFDKNNGQLTGLAPLNIDVDRVQGMDFDASTGIMYLAGFVEGLGKMYRVNPDSGVTSLVGLIGPGVQTAAFAIARKTPPCDRVTDISWMRLSQYAGTVLPNVYESVAVTLDATGLAAGVHSATLCVRSNDPLRRLLSVPVSFRVTDGAGDLIFKSGFDSN